MYPREYIVKFLQEPNRKTGQQPDMWEFQESSDITPGSGDGGWSDIYWMDEFVDQVPCSLFTGLPFPGIPEQQHDHPNNTQCYWVRTWIHPETNWVRARAIQEYDSSSSSISSSSSSIISSEWSEPICVPEPSASTLILVGIFLYWQLVKITKKRIKVKKRAET